MKEPRWRTPFEAHRARVVELLPRTELPQRKAALEEGGWNLFNLPADLVTVDLLTDSGTSALSGRQQADLALGDESYAGSRSFQRFEKVLRELTGYRHILPTHQGRAAERIMFGIVAGPGRTIVSNSLFDTTRANTEATKAEGLDLPCEASRDLFSEEPFKGDMDLAALERVLGDRSRTIPMVVLTLTNNSVAGQPVSLRNAREVARICEAHEVPLFLDVARFAENAWLVRKREAGQADRSPREIAEEMFRLADGCMMSAKKDAFAPIGGFIGLDDDDLARQLREQLILGEGFPTYGGLAGHDMELLASGLEEVTHEDYLQDRCDSVAELTAALRRAGVPVAWPPSGHAVYLDAGEFLPHLPLSRYPGQALACALYLAAGIRTCELGSVAFGRTDPETGVFRPAQRELVRLAIPRRVYTRRHLEWVAEVVIRLHEARESFQGVRMVWAPPALRHFSARFEPNDPDRPLVGAL